MPVTGAQIVAEAEKFRGDPYVWGAAGPTSFDCSGLVKYTLTQLGVKGVPRTSEDQWAWVDKIPASEAGPGDLVFFTGADPPSPGHVGIITAAGTAQHGPEMINAPEQGQPVQVDAFSESGTGDMHVVGYGRVPGSATSGASPGGGGGGLFSWPSEITGFFSDADHALGTASAVAMAFFRPSTYIRIAVGGLAIIFLISGLLFLIKAASGGQ